MDPKELNVWLHFVVVHGIVQLVLILSPREGKGGMTAHDGANYDTSPFGTVSGSGPLTSVLKSLFVCGFFLVQIKTGWHAELWGQQDIP